jgi:hypothetical protein
VVGFTSIEETALETVPRGENVRTLVQLTPTPRPTLAPTATTILAAGVSANSWQGSIDALFRNRCSTCHGRTAVGDLTLATYQDALKVESGMQFLNADASMVLVIQSAGSTRELSASHGR